MIPPLIFQWNGEAMIPARPSHADKHFVVGENYKLVEHKDRSRVSHNHFFATISEAHSNLPNELLEQYPKPEHLRKKALIFKGYRDERTIVLTSNAEAHRVAAFIKPIDEYAVVTVRDAVVRVWTAQSQSQKAMGWREFQDSKQAVLDYVDDLLGVERGATAENARRAA